MSSASAGEQLDDTAHVAALERLGEAGDERRSAGESGSGACSTGSGSSAVRARWSALVTDDSLTSSISATSAARNARTSRSTSTARWRGGRRCSATMNASPTASRCFVAGLEQRVRVRLEPDRLAPARRLRRERRVVGRSRQRGNPSAAVAERVQAAVRGDAVQPRAQRRAPLEAVEAAPRGEQRLLHEILGVLDGPEQPVAVHLQLTAMLLREFPEGVVADCAHTRASAIARRSCSAS